MEGNCHHCLDFIIYEYVVVFMVMEEVMVKGMTVKMVVLMAANECNFFYSEERNHCMLTCHEHHIVQ
jgi:hypothetical protein